MEEITKEQFDKIKSYQKEIVFEIDRICRTNNLRYYLAYGTLIGAIRHNGFIPWDDDIDVMMPIEDLERFEELIESQLDRDRFFYQSPKTEKEYRMTINRIRRNGTILETKDLLGKNVHKGVFVDIYPMYGAAEGGIKRKIQVVKAMIRALFMLEEPVYNHGRIMRIGSNLLLKITTKGFRARIAKRISGQFSKKTFSNSKCVTGLDSCIRIMSTSYPKEWFGNGTDHIFEDMVLRVPDKASKILNEYYGDYMVLPPESERKYHHNFINVKV